MKLPDRSVRLAACAALAAIVATGAGWPGTGVVLAAPSGPAADYPMVLGAPFTVDGVTYTPADVMNIDQVGYATVGTEGAGITLAHRTLPLPSYVEVTSLKTGRTILARVERRGPMGGSALIELSPAAAAQLAATAREPVRVRRVNPPEPERALLRMGLRAPERMETPMSLVGVLLRKLEPNAMATATPAPQPAVAAAPATGGQQIKPPAGPVKPSAGAVKPAQKPVVAAPAPAPMPAPKAEVKTGVKPATKPTEKPAAKPSAAPVSGGVTVQVGAFGNAANAAAAAKKTGGTIVAVGKLHAVRIGRFTNAAEAGAALAKAKAAGYSEARIQRAD